MRDHLRIRPNELPSEFLHKMRQLLDQEFPSFIDSYLRPSHRGLRVNQLKVQLEQFTAMSPFELRKVPWAPNGFYYPSDVSPAKHPYYHAGLYYIQEPSAMVPAVVLGAHPGERVLDLCAAPGGKATQIAADLGGLGVLVVNDSDSDRVKALTKNIELAGVRNAVVTCETPARLSHVFTDWFDRVLVDAPCSGEGMFRRDRQAAKSWSAFSSERCSKLQRDILESAAIMIRPGGILVYSTCTFAPEEDELAVESFLDSHPEYSLDQIELLPGTSRGRTEWASGRWDMTRTVRVWPHISDGEGHFVARFIRGVSRQADHSTASSRGKTHTVVYSDTPQAFGDFCSSVLVQQSSAHLAICGGEIIPRGDNLYLQPRCQRLRDLSGLNVVRPGWFLGIAKRGRFEPATALATALSPGEASQVIDLASTSGDVIRYLKCETLQLPVQLPVQSPIQLPPQLPSLPPVEVPTQQPVLRKGWVLVSTDGFTLGWAKHDGSILKNYYPSWWRWS